ERTRRSGTAERRPTPIAPEERSMGAARIAPLLIFSQDRTLQHSRVHAPCGEHEQRLPPDSDEIRAAKRRVLETGRPEDLETYWTIPEGRALVCLHIDPTFAADRTVDGIMCVAIDASRIGRPDSGGPALAGQVDATLPRYEAALRGSNVTVS